RHVRTGRGLPLRRTGGHRPADHRRHRRTALGQVAGTARAAPARHRLRGRGRDLRIGTALRRHCMTDTLILVDPTASTYELTELTAAQLPVTDRSAHRGDGIFEPVLVSLHGDGPTIVSRDRHFRRFCDSASALDLPEPVPQLWDRVIAAVTSALTAAKIGRAHVCTPVTFRSRMPSSA